MSNMVVQTNILALNSHRNMKTTGTMQAKASARLSSGYKINSAADDAAGLAISEKMRAQIRGLDMASKNAQDGISLIQTAEGGLTEVDNMIQRIRELTVQAANDTNTTDTIEATAGGTTGDRDKILKEITQLITEIDKTGERIKFNNRTLLKNDEITGLQFQVGSNKDELLELENIDIKLNSTDGIAFDLTTAFAATFTTTMGSTGISNLLSDVDKALTTVTTARAQLGAYQNRLEYTIKSLDISSENISDAESRIRNTDMAKEMMNATKANVLQQASISMLAQANQAPQNILQLLR